MPELTNAIQGDISVKDTVLELTPELYDRLVKVTLGTLTTRIVFGELITGTPDPNFHTAIVMPTSDVVSLAHLILRLYDKNLHAKKTDEVISGSVPYRSLSDML